MYNRYIPQSDGSYRRSRIPDNPPVSASPKHNSHSAPEEPHIPASEPEAPCANQQEFAHKHNPPKQACPRQGGHSPRPRPYPPKQEYHPEPGGSISGFLRQLLPKNFDTGDLLVVILLLLMAGDCNDDQNMALLTLALYLFI